MPQISTKPHGMGRGFSNINRAKWKRAPSSKCKSEIFGPSKQGVMDKEKLRVITAKVRCRKQAMHEITAAEELYYSWQHAT